MLKCFELLTEKKLSFVISSEIVSKYEKKKIKEQSWL
jgi:hypothetical protein